MEDDVSESNADIERRTHDDGNAAPRADSWTDARTRAQSHTRCRGGYRDRAAEIDTEGV
ncbi:hypothetical protein [Halorubellus litoreus]|uniref:Uncharacterized protein n=1 Tax=Halorubellus litoreus TaxID=755308 RepID=A0ABD5VG86_9EURY